MGIGKRHIGIFIASYLILACQTSKEPSLKKQLRNLDYRYHKAEVPYFAAHGKEGAIDSLHHFYTSAIQYFEQQFDTKIPLQLVFIKQQDYNKLRMSYQPYYGIPFTMEGILIIPIEAKGLVFKYLAMQLRDGPRDHIEKFQQTLPFNSEGVSSVMHITAVHEICRYLQNVMHLPAEPKWLNDFMSSYLMIDYLHHHHPVYNPFVNSFCHLVTNEISPSYKNLEVFERKYLQDEHSYSWYQSKIHLAAYNIYQQEGMALFNRYRGHVSQETQGLMPSLDTLIPYLNP